MTCFVQRTPPSAPFRALKLQLAPFGVSLSLACVASAQASETFGFACPGATGHSPVLELRSDVKPGLPIRADVFGAPSTPALVMVGTSATIFGGIALPLDLGTLFSQASGCFLYQNTVATVPIALDAGGAGLLEFEGWSEGIELFLQVWNLDLDPSSLTTLGGFSAGLRVQSTPVSALQFLRQVYIPNEVSLGTSQVRPEVGVCDLDGDGNLEVLESLPGLEKIRVLRGGPQGALVPGLEVDTVGPAAGPFRFEDFNGDGSVDLAVALPEALGVRVLLGDGGGDFAAVVEIPVPGRPSSVAAGDLDGDGDIDLVVPNQYSDGFSTLTNTGAGAFLVGGNEGYIAGSGPLWIELVDMDRDGTLDVILTRTGIGEVSVSLGAGDGTFGLPIRTPVADTPAQALCADLSGDGTPDLVTTHSDGVDRVEFRIGVGDGTFEPAVAVFNVPDAAVSSLADQDQDGLLDVLVSRDQTFTSVQSIRGVPGGLASTGVALPATAASRVLSVDLDQDGHSDLVGQSGDLVSGDLFVLRGAGNGQFVEGLAIDASIFIGDFNEDGWPDVGGPDFFAGQGNVLSFSASDGAGGFEDPIVLPWLKVPPLSIQNAPAELLPEDIDGDGHLDLLTLHANDPLGGGFSVPALSVRFGDGAGGFTPGPVTVFPPGAQYMVGTGSGGALQWEVVRFGGDGHWDVALKSKGYGWMLWKGASDGTFSLQAEFLEGLQAGDVADVNGDGRVDLVSGDAGEIRVWLGQASGDFLALPPVASPLVFADLEAEDFDGDGFDDLIVNQVPNDLLLLRGLGNGQFEPPVVLNPEPNPFLGPAQTEVLLLIEDLDLDGHQDLVTRRENRRWGIRRGRGDGTFQDSLDVLPLLDAFPFVFAEIVPFDMDRDGDLDLVIDGHVIWNLLL